jgi:hypothetical protein
MSEQAREQTQEEIDAKVAEIEAFAIEHGLYCTGSPTARSCDKPSIVGVVLHGVTVAAPCVVHLHEMSQAIMDAGHGAFRQDGLRTMVADFGAEKLKAWCEMRRAYVREHGISIPRGRYYDGPKQ